MEVPEPTRRASPAGDQPAPTPGPPGAPGGQALPRLALGPVILPLLEQGLAPTVFLKALPVPLYHTVPPGGLQPRAPLVTGSLDGGGVPLLLSPLLQPEGPGPPQAGKPSAPQLTVNIVGALPVLSPGLGPMLGSLGKARSAGKYLCPHCSRDCLKPSVLEKHVRSHTGERPFPCTTCGIAFKTQSNLYKHRRTQTHLNNTRLSSESDGAGGSLLEEGDKAGEAPREAREGDSGSQGGGDGAPSEKPPAHRCPVARNLDMKPEAVPCPGSAFADREAPGDATHTAPPGFPAASSQPRRKLPEQRSPTASRPSSLQQQPPQAATWEKPWDAKAPEGRLRKCESTDSGYLSRSDSAEQPQAACSPLHSLSEHSAESEGEGTPGPRGAGPEPARRGASLELEKRRLEERIARLISHNQAVVDDPQLDNVRPRKTVLSKQGSIDLPVPYTYKDSFHFEIRAPEPGRRRHGALGSVRSTCTLLDKARPLFFHSVPTQLSTTAECVPVTRSNSLPFVEGTRTWQEPPDPQDACPRRQKALSPRPAPARLLAVPSGHPRALVRQAAVEDLPCPHTGDTAAPAEGRDGERSALGEGPAGKGSAGRRCGQRKLKMFSQEKWRVYGNETFKRIYQKMKTSHPGGRKAREAGVGQGTEQALPLQGEAAGGRDGVTLVCGDTPAAATPGPRGSPPAAEALLVTEPPEPRETEAGAGGSDQPRVSRAESPTTIGCREPPCLDTSSPLLPPSGRLEQGCQLPPAPGPLKEGALEADRPHPQLEGGACHSDRVVKEACPRAQTVLRWPGASSGEPQPTEDQLPSEKKKLRVEELSCQEPLGSLGATAEISGGPEQTDPLPSWNQEGDPGDEPAGLHRTADRTSGASPTASAAAPRLVGLGDKRPTLCPVAEAPGCRSQPVWAPGVLAALADAAFPPKYLLRLPQGETLPPPPGAQGPGQDPLCRSGGPEQPVSFAGSGLGTLLPPGPASSPAPAGAEGFGEDPSWSQLWGGGKGVQEEENGDLDARTTADREAPGSTSGAPKATASFLCTPTCDARRTETRGPGDPCLGSARARARPSGGVRQPWAPSREVGGPPERAPEEPPAGPASLLSALAPPGWPEPAPCTRTDTPGSFPSLRTEPRLTWCCLTRSLPLPAEQTEKAASVYLALHVPAGSPPAKGLDARPESKDVSGGWTRPSPRQGGQTQTPKVTPALPRGAGQREPALRAGSHPCSICCPLPRGARLPEGRGDPGRCRRTAGNCDPINRRGRDGCTQDSGRDSWHKQTYELPGSRGKKCPAEHPGSSTIIRSHLESKSMHPGFITGGVMLPWGVSGQGHCREPWSLRDSVTVHGDRSRAWTPEPCRPLLSQVALSSS